MLDWLTFVNPCRLFHQISSMLCLKYTVSQNYSGVSNKIENYLEKFCAHQSRIFSNFFPNSSISLDLHKSRLDIHMSGLEIHMSRLDIHVFIPIRLVLRPQAICWLVYSEGFPYCYDWHYLIACCII